MLIIDNWDGGVTAPVALGIMTKSVIELAGKVALKPLSDTG